MKKIALALLITGYAALNQAQTSVSLAIVHQIDGAEFSPNQVFTSAENYAFSVTRLEYYVSGIEIVHDGGQITPVEDTWLLVDASGPYVVNLGSFDINEIEGINFSVGVDFEHNHLDPSTYPADHPLAPQNPSMHWGWVSGYRFAAFEGLSGPELLTVFEVHALGNDNYHQTELTGEAHGDGDSRMIVINANYNGLLEGVNVSGGLVVHGETQHAALLLDNFRDHVFSLSSEPLNVENETTKPVHPGVYPNPLRGEVFTIDKLALGNHTIEILSMDGRLVWKEESSGSTEKINAVNLENGSYLVRITSGGQNYVSRLMVAR